MKAKVSWLDRLHKNTCLKCGLILQSRKYLKVKGNSQRTIYSGPTLSLSFFCSKVNDPMSYHSVLITYHPLSAATIQSGEMPKDVITKNVFPVTVFFNC